MSMSNLTQQQQTVLNALSTQQGLHVLNNAGDSETAQRIQAYLQRATPKYKKAVTGNIERNDFILKKNSTDTDELDLFIRLKLVVIELEGKIAVLVNDDRETEEIAEEIQKSRGELAAVKAILEDKYKLAENKEKRREALELNKALTEAERKNLKKIIDENRLNAKDLPDNIQKIINIISALKDRTDCEKYYNRLSIHIDAAYKEQIAKRDYKLSRVGKTIAILFSLSCGIPLTQGGLELTALMGASGALAEFTTVLLFFGMPGVLLANWWIGRDNMPALFTSIANALSFETDIEHKSLKRKALMFLRHPFAAFNYTLCIVGGVVSGIFAYAKSMDFLRFHMLVDGMGPELAMAMSGIIALGAFLLCSLLFIKCAKKLVWSTRIWDDAVLLKDAILSDHTNAQALMDELIARKQARLDDNDSEKALRQAQDTLIGSLLHHKIDKGLYGRARSYITITTCIPFLLTVVLGAVFTMLSALPAIESVMGTELAYIVCVAAGFSYTYMFGKATLQCIADAFYQKPKTEGHAASASFAQKLLFQYSRASNSLMNAGQAGLGAYALGSFCGLQTTELLIISIVIAAITSFVMNSMAGKAVKYDERLKAAESEAGIAMSELGQKAELEPEPQPALTWVYNGLHDVRYSVPGFRQDSTDAGVDNVAGPSATGLTASPSLTF